MIEQGFHTNVSAEAYHADHLAPSPSLSSSIAKILLRESAFKAWHSHPRLNPAFVDESRSKFDIGTAAHALLLEGLDRMHVVQFEDWRKKEAKEQRELARSAGKLPILAHHAEDVRAMVGKALAFLELSEIAHYWFKAGSEVTGLVEENGVWLKARFDRLSHDRLMIADYKSTGDASPEMFTRQLVRMGYHWQDAFYRRVASALGARDTKFVFLAQSTEAPYECSLHGCDPALREIADADIEHAIALWRDCITKNEWRSYGGRIYWTMPTNWQMAAHEQRLQEEAA